MCSTLRSTDSLVFGWSGGKHAYIDLTWVSSLVGLERNGFTAGQAALKVASCKVTKHEKICLDNQHVFIRFTFDISGFLAPEIHSNVMTPISIDLMFKRSGFCF